MNTVTDAPGAAARAPAIVTSFAAPEAPWPDARWAVLTLPQLFAELAGERSERVMLRQKEFGLWRPLTWRAGLAEVKSITLGLALAGFEPGDTACILANTSREWLLADLGIQSAGGVCAGIYPTDAPAQVEHVLHDCGAALVFVEDEEQLDKVLAVRARLPKLRRVVIFDMYGLAGLRDAQVESLDAVCRRGREAGESGEALWRVRLASRSRGDLAVLIYTSGTTGRPKGAMFLHQTVMAAMRPMVAATRQNQADERLCYLPLCHIAEKFATAYVSLLTATVLNFVESPETVLDNLRELQPTVFLGVPRVWEKLYSGVRLRLAEATWLEQRAYEAALRLGRRAAEAGERGGIWLRVAAVAARWLVLDNLRRSVGLHRARVLLTGAAPIAPELILWFRALGLPLVEVYGSTECGGLATCNPHDAPRVGTVGRPAPGVEVALSAEGEVLVRGPGLFVGYLHLEVRTAETLVGGWLRSGDVGELDADGYLRITDRMKDIIITAGGKNVAPSEIENQLKFSPYISDAVVIGDRRKYLSCLVMIDHENVEHYAQTAGVPFSSFESLCRARPVQDLIAAEIARVNDKLARVEQVKKFRLIEHQLTPEDEELTPTMKLKRKLVNEKYQPLIDQMYEEE